MFRFELLIIFYHYILYGARDHYESFAEGKIGICLVVQAPRNDRPNETMYNHFEFLLFQYI